MTAATLITLLHTNSAISGVIVDKRSEFISTAFVTGSSNIVVREFLWRASGSANIVVREFLWRASWTPNVVVRELLWKISLSSNIVARELLWTASWFAVANPDVMELVTILFV